MQKLAQLRISNRFGGERVLDLNKAVFTIGRKAENDLQLLHDTVSRQHAEIIQEDDNYFLVDVGSKRGTFVNGQQIKRIALEHLDRIRIGGDESQEIQFVDQSIELASAIFDSQTNLKLTDSHAERRRDASANDELQKLARFVEVNEAFKFSLTPDDVLCLIVDAAIEITQAERGFLMLRNDIGDLEFKVARDRERNWLIGKDFAMSRSVVEEAFRQNRSIIINDELLPPQRESVRHLELRSIACIPLRRFQMSENMDATTMFKRDVIGVLYVDSQVFRGALNETSLRLLESLAFEATKSLESVRLMHEEQEKKVLEGELNIARQVQIALSPTALRQAERFDVSAASVPSRFLGGDFYDFIALDDQRYAFALGDISGKGIGAALMAAMSQGAIQAEFASHQPLSNVISHVNKVLIQKSASGHFLTLFCAVLDAEGRFQFVNAGHNPPILARADGRIELLSTGALLLGAFTFASYEAKETQLGPGDVIVIYTDGVTEAVNSSEEMFGDERLESLVRGLRGMSADEIKTRILDEVIAFTRGLPQGDDITLITIKFR
jgi:serine phosphatase RsbU (regulator of sigma subunit)